MFSCCACCTSEHKVGHADACQRHQRADGIEADKAWRKLTIDEKIKAGTR